MIENFDFERGRYKHVSREQCYCELCNYDIIGDEFHFKFMYSIE